MGRFCRFIFWSAKAWPRAGTIRQIILPLIVLLWVLAMTISHGSSTKFIYFDF